MKPRWCQKLATRIFSFVLCHDKERERAVMTTLRSFASEPRGEKIHKPESQSFCKVMAAGISIAFVGSPRMNGDGIVAVWVSVLSFHVSILRVRCNQLSLSLIL